MGKVRTLKEVIDEYLNEAYDPYKTKYTCSFGYKEGSKIFKITIESNEI